jgi:acetyl esterase
VLIYPAVDPFGDYPSRTENATGYFLDQPMMEWFFTHYATGHEELAEDDVRLSPLRGDLAGLAPALVVTAEFDPLRDEGEAYAARLAEAGVGVDVVRYDGMIHGFLDMGPFSEAAAAAVDDLVARTKKLLHG